MEKMIVIGASGFLGTAVTSLASENYQVLATYRERPCPITSSNTENVRLDFGTEATVKELENIVGHLDTVIVTSNIEYGQQNELTIRNYQSFLRNLVVRNIKTVYVSTDAVFDGRETVYTEESAPNPITEYGRRKLESERLIGVGSNVIIRTSYLYGSNGFVVDKRLREIKNAAANGDTVKRYKCMIRNPVHVRDLANAILRLKGESGVFHVAGPAMSVYDFAIRLAEEVGIKVSIEELEPEESEKSKVPMNTNLTSLRLQGLGIAIPSMEDHEGSIYLESGANYV